MTGKRSGEVPWAGDGRRGIGMLDTSKKLSLPDTGCSRITVEGLRAFSAEIAEAYNSGVIKAPVHLSGGNEEQLISIFKEVCAGDWVFSTHRSHYHALLKGIPAEWVKGEIMVGRSMHLFSQKHKFFTSAIVGGVIPIALGVAMRLNGLKQDGLALYDAVSGDMGQPGHVWCFVGDMAAEMGVFHEAVQYAWRHGLKNLTYVIEDNGQSVNTPTQLVWGTEKNPMKDWLVRMRRSADTEGHTVPPLVMSYEYDRKYPHVGAGKWVVFP